MHILADTWAHRYYAGTPSLVINNINNYFYEILREDGAETERKVAFHHNLTAPDDLEASLYTSSIYQGEENTIMNLGHGRAGHIPDYFEKERYDEDAAAEWKDEIIAILEKRQLDSCADWKVFGERLSGRTVEDFDIARYEEKYINASGDDKGDTFLGKFFLAAGIKKIVYYFTMARHMVGGIEIFYKSVILLDLGIFVFCVSDIPQTVAMLYLIGDNAFRGVVDVLHSFDEKKLGKSSWKLNFAYGAVKVLLAVSGLVFIRSVEALIIIYCIGLLQSAVRHIVKAFRKTAIIYVG